MPPEAVPRAVPSVIDPETATGPVGLVNKNGAASLLVIVKKLFGVILNDALLDVEAEEV